MSHLTEPLILHSPFTKLGNEDMDFKYFPTSFCIFQKILCHVGLFFNFHLPVALRRLDMYTTTIITITRAIGAIASPITQVFAD